MEIIKKILKKGKKAGIIGIFLALAFVAGNSTNFPKNEHATPAQVLSVSSHTLPSITNSPSPTPVPVIVINNIIVPTQAPIVVAQVVTPTPIQSGFTPTQIPIVTPTPTGIPTLIQSAPTSTFSPTPTPTQAIKTAEIEIDYAGEHAASTYTDTITPGETAWQIVQESVGLTNILYTDYGGNLGIFITGFNGVSADANQYYDFQVNGISSTVGVSTYTVANHDILKFVLTSF